MKDNSTAWIVVGFFVVMLLLLLGAMLFAAGMTP
jgi:hypothetical protein